VKFKVLIMQTTGDFEISEGGSLTVNGKIRQIEPTEADILTARDRPVMELSRADVYKELRLRGYDYGPAFQGISAADINGTVLVK
jgi:fatty acid synthase